MNMVLAQLRPAPRNTSRNLETVRKIVAESGDVDLVVFPELFLSGYTTSKPEELALDLEGSEMDAIARLARENSTAVILGVPERAPAGIANSAVCVDRYGDITGSYRKTHLFGSERRAYVAGNELLIVDPAEQTVTWLGLRASEYEPVGHSGLIELGPTELAAQLHWP